jgi:hypothetical protein
MSISKETFIDYMQRLGFEYIDAVNVWGNSYINLFQRTGRLKEREGATKY